MMAPRDTKSLALIMATLEVVANPVLMMDTLGVAMEEVMVEIAVPMEVAMGVERVLVPMTDREELTMVGYIRTTPWIQEGIPRGAPSAMMTINAKPIRNVIWRRIPVAECAVNLVAPEDPEKEVVDLNLDQVVEAERLLDRVVDNRVEVTCPLTTRDMVPNLEMVVNLVLMMDTLEEEVVANLGLTTVLEKVVTMEATLRVIRAVE